MQVFFWTIGMFLVFLPVILSFFTVFLMLTNEAVEPDAYYDDAWDGEIDQMAKRYYKSRG